MNAQVLKLSVPALVASFAILFPRVSPAQQQCFSGGEIHLLSIDPPATTMLNQGATYNFTLSVSYGLTVPAPALIWAGAYDTSTNINIPQQQQIITIDNQSGSQTLSLQATITAFDGSPVSEIGVRAVLSQQGYGCSTVFDGVFYSTVAAPPPQSYTITDLGALGNYGSVGTGINASGQVTGYISLGQSGPLHAFIYTPGANAPMVDIGLLLPTGTFSQGMGINASGQVTGWTESSGVIHAFRYDPQTQQFVDIGSLGGTHSYGFAINDSGWVTGYSDTLTSSTHHAFLYNTSMADIDPFGGTFSQGLGINASGKVTGWGYPQGEYFNSHAFVYTPGIDSSFKDIGMLPNATYSQGKGINASGQVTGESGPAGPVGSDSSHAFLYDPLTQLMTDLDPNGAFGASYGAGINASGQIVGAIQSNSLPFLYSPGKGMIDLNSLLPYGSGWSLVYAASINDSGQMAGWGYINGEQHAFLLAPSEPITQPLHAGGGTASFVFDHNIYNIVFDYPSGFVTEGSTLTVTASQTSQAAWALRTPDGTPYFGTQIAPVFGLGGDGIIYRAVCKDASGDPCPEASGLYTITTSWKGPAGDKPGFLKAPIGTNNWENVFVSYSPDRSDGGPDPTGSGKSCCHFSDWAFVYSMPVVTVTVSATKTLNAPNPPLTPPSPNNVTYTGFMNNDNSTNSLSGTLTCATTATTTSPVGSYPITCSGLTSSKYAISYNGTLTIRYAAAGGTCGGDLSHTILQPINADGTSVWKQGRTIPVKFRVCDANGASIGTPGVVASFNLVQITSGTVANVDESATSTNADTAFRWDLGGEQWILNMSTKNLSAGRTYVYEIGLNDGSMINLQFGLR